MSKRNIIIITIAVVLIVGLVIYLLVSVDNDSTVQETTANEETTTKVAGNCQFNEMIFYYSNGCGYCTRVKTDGSIQRLADLGIQTEQIDTSVGPINHQLEGVPTFVVNDQAYPGYRTYDQLKTLLGCT